MRKKIVNILLMAKEYYKEVFKLSKEVFKREKIIILFLFIIGFVPNILEINILETPVGIPVLPLLPIYILKAIEYFSLDSVFKALNIDILRVIGGNMIILYILKIAKDITFIYMIGKSISILKKNNFLKDRRIFLRTVIVELIYIFPMFFITTTPRLLWMLKIRPQRMILMSFFILVVMGTVFIIFLYFVPLYISEEVSLRKGFSESIELSKNNRMKGIFMFIIYLLILFLSIIVMIVITNIISSIFPYIPTEKDKAGFLNIYLNSAIPYVLLTNIIKIIFSVFLSSLIATVFCNINYSSKR